MALTKYIPRTVPTANQRVFITQELQSIQAAIANIVTMLQVIDAQIEIGANDSGGAGYRMLRIPNA